MRDKIGVTACLHCLPWQKEFDYYDLRNMVRYFANAGANRFRFFFYYDGHTDRYGPTRMITPYPMINGKFDLSRFNDAFFERVRWLGDICHAEGVELVLDVLDNCSFGFGPNEPHQPWVNNVQDIEVNKYSIYGKTPAALTLIRDLFSEYWDNLRFYPVSMLKIGICNEATWFDWGRPMDYYKYEDQANWHKWIVDEVYKPLAIPKDCWRANTMMKTADAQAIYLGGVEGESAWTWVRGRAFDADSPDTWMCEIEMHEFGSKAYAGIFPEKWIETVFTPPHRRVWSFSDDGTADGQGEHEEGAWGAETPEEFGALTRQILVACLSTGVWCNVEHLMRECNTKFDAGFTSWDQLDDYFGDLAGRYFDQANIVYKDLTGGNLSHRGQHQQFIDRPECREGDEVTETCWDGSKIVVKRCVNGRWQDTGATCPVPPPPPPPPEKSCYEKYIKGRPIRKWDVGRFFICVINSIIRAWNGLGGEK